MNTIENLFSWFLAASIRGSILGLATIAVQLVLRRQLSPGSRYALWLPAVVVLCAPWLPFSSLSAERWFAPAPPLPQVLVESNATAVGDMAAEPLTPPVAANPPGQRNWRLTAGVLWLSGCAILLVGSVAAYVTTLRRIRARRLGLNPALERLLHEAAADCGIARAPKVIISTAVKSPALSGFLRPLLLLPPDFPGELTPSEAHLVLVHELIHLKRWDLPLNWMLCLLQVIHWCNPFLWFIFNRIRGDREAACDARVLAACRDDSRSDYGHALLKLESAGAQSGGLSLGFVGIFEHGGSIRARMREIAGYRKSHPAWNAVSALLVAAMLALGASRAEQPAGKSPIVASPGHEPAVNPRDLALIRREGNLGSEAAMLRDGVQGKLNSIIIPKLEFRETTAAESLAFLERRSRDLDTAEPDPAKRGVKFTLLLSPAEPASDARITISLKNIPLGEAVKYVTSLANLKYRVQPQGVEIVSRQAADLLVVKEFKVEPKTLGEKGLKPTDDAKQFLTRLGVSFPEGATAAFASENRLIVKAKQDDIDLTAAWLARPAPSEVKGESNETKPPAAPPAEGDAAGATAALQRKLDTVIIPKVAFRQATVREAVDFLRRKSGELDTAEADPAKRGVSVVLKPLAPVAGSTPGAARSAVPSIPGLEAVPSAPAAAENDPFQAKVTVSLANIPLGEVFRYVCSLANLQMKVEPHAIVLSPVKIPGN